MQLVGLAVFRTPCFVPIWAPRAHGQELQDIRKEKSHKNCKISPPWSSGRAPWGR